MRSYPGMKYCITKILAKPWVSRFGKCSEVLSTRESVLVKSVPGLNYLFVLYVKDNKNEPIPNGKERGFMPCKCAVQNLVGCR